MLRRQFVAATAFSTLARAQQKWRVCIATSGLERIESAGTVYRRAYAACGQRGQPGLLTGLYPHAASPGNQTMETLLKSAGHTFRFIDGPLPDDALLPATIAVSVGENPDATGDFRDKELRIPLGILAPGLPPGAYDQLVTTVDILPTVLALCGMEVPASLHGRNLLKNHVEYVCMEGKLGQPGEWRAVVRGYEKLIVDRNSNVTHLFNLSEDPEEADNLARHYDKSQQLRLRADALNALLQIWRRQTNDGRSGSGLKKRGK